MSGLIQTIFHPKENIDAFRELVLLLTKYKELTFELAKREFKDHYAGQFFGLFWTFAHPTILILIYVFIFGVVFQARVPSNLNAPSGYVAYLLAGLIPWITFMESMTKSSTVIISNASIVKQMIFPVEVLPVKSVLATLFTELILLALLLLYLVLVKKFIPFTYMLFPLLLLLQVFAMIGVGYILSSVSPYVRDIGELVRIFSVVGIYLIPLFFVPESVPGIFRPVLYLNPFSHLIWCYQDVLCFGKIIHPWSWLIVSISSLTIFILGYRVFRKLKNFFGNAL